MDTSFSATMQISYLWSLTFSLPFIGIFLALFWTKLDAKQKILFVIVAYLSSLLSLAIFSYLFYGFVFHSNDTLRPGFIIAIATLLYCIIFAWRLINKPMEISNRAKKKDYRSDTDQPLQKEVSKEGLKKLDPIIMVALIQAVASIIVALIAKML